MQKFYATLIADIYDLSVSDKDVEMYTSNIVEKFILKVDKYYKVNYLTIEFDTSSINTDEENDTYRTLEFSFLLSKKDSDTQVEAQLHNLLQAVETSFRASVKVTDFNEIIQ